MASLVGSVVKDPPAGNTEEEGLIHWLGRSPGGENGNPLQHSHLENSIDREELDRLQSMGLQRAGHD